MAAVCGPLFGHAIGPLIAKRAAIGGQRRRSGAVPTSRVKIMSDKASGEAQGACAANASISEPFRRLPFCRTWRRRRERIVERQRERPRGDRLSAACPSVDHWGHSAACSRIVFDV